MSQVPTYLENAESVVRAFGCWPSFHDAPVVAFRRSEAALAEVELTLHAYTPTAELDDRGYFKLINHHLVSFSFRGVSDFDFALPTADNILFELVFSVPEEVAATGKFKVLLDSAMDPSRGGSFHARTGTVTAVTPCDGRGEVI